MMIERMLTAKADEEGDWWQEIADLAYCLDGKAPEDWHAMLQRVAAGMSAPDPSGTLEDFKRYAVCHLIQIIAAGPCPWAEIDAEFAARHARGHAALRRGEIGIVGESDEQATLRKEKAKLEALKELAGGPSTFVLFQKAPL
jgi:hypothetical protein